MQFSFLILHRIQMLKDVSSFPIENRIINLTSNGMKELCFPELECLLFLFLFLHETMLRVTNIPFFFEREGEFT